MEWILFSRSCHITMKFTSKSSRSHFTSSFLDLTYQSPIYNLLSTVVSRSYKPGLFFHQIYWTSSRSYLARSRSCFAPSILHLPRSFVDIISLCFFQVLLLTVKSKLYFIDPTYHRLDPTYQGYQISFTHVFSRSNYVHPKNRMLFQCTRYTESSHLSVKYCFEETEKIMKILTIYSV